MRSGSGSAEVPKAKARLDRSAPSLEARVRGMLDKLRTSGLKITAQRVAVVRELAADPTHPTAQELFERLRAAQPAMSFATVYNTLDALAAAGLCSAMSLAPGASRFDANMAPHHHAVCDTCGLVRDIPLDEPAAPASGAAPLPSAPGFQVRAVERIYRGVCAACARAEARAARSAAGGPSKDNAAPSPPRKRRRSADLERRA